MSQSHVDHIVAHYGEYAEYLVIPGKADLLALSDKATFYPADSYDGVTFGSDVGGLHPPAGLGEERPCMQHGKDFYVYCHNGDMGAYFKLALNHPPMCGENDPDLAGIKAAYANAEVEDMDVKYVGSCLHYLCENSFGFSTTHPRYDEKTWLKPIQEQVKAYHGPGAYAFLDSACNLIGMQSYSLPDDERMGNAIDILLMAAQVSSEWHRKVRVL
jgi:hypothetical protein